MSLSSWWINMSRVGRELHGGSMRRGPVCVGVYLCVCIREEEEGAGGYGGQWGSLSSQQGCFSFNWSTCGTITSFTQTGYWWQKKTTLSLPLLARGRDEEMDSSLLLMCGNRLHSHRKLLLLPWNSMQRRSTAVSRKGADWQIQKWTVDLMDKVITCCNHLLLSRLFTGILPTRVVKKTTIFHRCIQRRAQFEMIDSSICVSVGALALELPFDLRTWWWGWFMFGHCCVPRDQDECVTFALSLTSRGRKHWEGHKKTEGYMWAFGTTSKTFYN